MPLTDAKIKSLKTKDKSYKTADFGGLYIEVSTTGSKLWRLKYRIAGREKRLSFGAYPAVSLTDARKSRDAAKALLAKGLDPRQAKQEQKRGDRAQGEHTFSRLADKFLDKGRAEGRAKATQIKNAWLLEKAKADFGHLNMAEITVPIILNCLCKVESRRY